MKASNCNDLWNWKIVLLSFCQNYNFDQTQLKFSCNFTSTAFDCSYEYEEGQGFRCNGQLWSNSTYIYDSGSQGMTTYGLIMVTRSWYLISPHKLILYLRTINLKEKIISLWLQETWPCVLLQKKNDKC